LKQPEESKDCEPGNPATVAQKPKPIHAATLELIEWGSPINDISDDAKSSPRLFLFSHRSQSHADQPASRKQKKMCQELPGDGCSLGDQELIDSGLTKSSTAASLQELQQTIESKFELPISDVPKGPHSFAATTALKRSHILPPSEMKSLYGSMTRSAVTSLSNFRYATYLPSVRGRAMPLLAQPCGRNGSRRHSGLFCRRGECRHVVSDEILHAQRLLSR
jgi:hypothetical protein